MNNLKHGLLKCEVCGKQPNVFGLHAPTFALCLADYQLWTSFFRIHYRPTFDGTNGQQWESLYHRFVAWQRAIQLPTLTVANVHDAVEPEVTGDFGYIDIRPLDEEANFFAQLPVMVSQYFRRLLQWARNRRLFYYQPAHPEALEGPDNQPASGSTEVRQ